MPRAALMTLLALALGTLLALADGSSAVAAQPTKRPTDADRGRELYNRHCVQCHGVAARGDGPASRALVHPPADLQGKVRADDPTIQIVRGGKGPMPAFDQSFGVDDSRRVLQFMAGLTDKGPPPAAAPAPAPAGEEEEEEGGDAPAEGPG